MKSFSTLKNTTKYKAKLNYTNLIIAFGLHCSELYFDYW